MIKISKQEAFTMRDQGYEEFVKHSYSKHPTYYLVEETNDVYAYNPDTHRKSFVRLSAMNALKKIRENKRVNIEN